MIYTMPAYLLVDSDMLPEVFRKVMEAKMLLASSRAKNASEAAKMVGISRSAFYKYKDSVHLPSNRVDSEVATYYMTLEDRPGVLSSVLSEIYRNQANILTVNQNIPMDGVAVVSISARVNEADIQSEKLTQCLKQIPGVVDIKRALPR